MEKVDKKIKMCYSILQCYKEAQRMDKIEKAKKILEEQKQTHIKVINEQIAEQILNIDFAQLQNLYSKADEKLQHGKLEPVKAINPDKMPTEKIEEYIKNGEEVVKNNKFAVAIMAGGQGTRLRTFWS